MVYWYPTGASIVDDVDYIIEKTTNRFFTSASSLTLLKASTVSAFQVDGVVHTEYIIGATGVTSKIIATITGTSA